MLVIALVLGLALYAHLRLRSSRAVGLPRRTWFVLALCLAFGELAAGSLGAIE